MKRDKNKLALREAAKKERNKIMDRLMNAAKAGAADLTPAVEGFKESKVNILKFNRIIARVFCESYERFVGHEDDVDSVIDELMNDSKFILSINKKGVNENCITIKEALKWTAHYIKTGEKLRFVLVAAFTPDVSAKSPEALNIQLWTAAVLSTTKISSTEPYKFNCCGKDFAYDIVNTSTNLYDVKLR